MIEEWRTILDRNDFERARLPNFQLNVRRYLSAFLDGICAVKLDDYPTESGVFSDRVWPFELIKQNHLYGANLVLRDHFGITQRDLNISIPHGGVLSGNVWLADALASFFYCSSAITEAAFNMASLRVSALPNETWPRAVLGPPIILLARQNRLKRRVALPQSRHVLFFLDHGTTSRQDVADYSDGRIQKLPADVVMVASYNRINSYALSQIADRSSVTLGTMYDPAFFPRLEYLLSSSKLVGAETLSSSLIYSALLGIDSVLLADGEPGVHSNDGDIAYARRIRSRSVLAENLSLLGEYKFEPEFGRYGRRIDLKRVAACHFGFDQNTQAQLTSASRPSSLNTYSYTGTFPVITVF